MNATIYDPETDAIITEGLQSAIVCDEALQQAERIAAWLGRPVRLEDDGDGLTCTVHPDGDVTDTHETVHETWC